MVTTQLSNLYILSEALALSWSDRLAVVFNHIQPGFCGLSLHFWLCLRLMLLLEQWQQNSGLLP